MLDLGVIVLDSGKTVSIEEWQKVMKFDSDHIADHVSITNDNVSCDNELVLHEMILVVFEMLRSKIGKPIKITSGFRTQKKQAELYAQNLGAAALGFSTHQLGLALDLHAGTSEIVDRYVRELRKIRQDISIRIGWKKYLSQGRYFVHIDCAPEFFKNKRRRKNFPKFWFEKKEW